MGWDDPRKGRERFWSSALYTVMISFRFPLERRLQFAFVLLGQIVDFVFGFLDVVLALPGAFLHRFERFLAFVADVADGDFVLLQALLDLLHLLLAVLFGHRRKTDADDLAVVVDRQPEIRGLDPALDVFDRLRIEGFDGQHARVGAGDDRDVLERRGFASVGRDLDMHVLERLGAGLSGADGFQIRLEIGGALRHFLFRVQQYVVSVHDGAFLVRGSFFDNAGL